MKVGIIGAGRVGCALAFSLADREIIISGIYSKKSDSAAFASEKSGCLPESNLQGLVKKADVIFITVPDSQIMSVSEQISSLCSGADINGKVFLHCSGALTSEVLRHLDDKGGFTGSLHPIQTFSDRENTWKGMFNIYFGFEGSPEAGCAASKIVGILDGQLLMIKSETKPVYHAAACMLSNYTVTISHIAGKLLEMAGIKRDIGIKAFGPLLRNTVNNIMTMGSTAALTGPISRGDCYTVEGHLTAINIENPEIEDLYKILGRATVQLALVKGSIGNDEALAMLDILK